MQSTAAHTYIFLQQRGELVENVSHLWQHLKVTEMIVNP